MIIRPEQVRAFQSADTARFIERQIAHVSEHWPEECADLRDETSSCVERAVRRAFEHGLKTEFDVGRFVDLVFAFEDPDFDRQNWAASLLRDQSVDATLRTDRLWAEAMARLEQQEKAEPEI